MGCFLLSIFYNLNRRHGKETVMRMHDESILTILMQRKSHMHK